MYPYRHISSQDSSFRIRSTQGADFRLCADFSGLTQFCCQFFDSCFNTSFDAGSSRCSEYYDDHDYDCCNDDDTVLFKKCFHPEGLGAKLVMLNALEDAELKPEDID